MQERTANYCVFFLIVCLLTLAIAGLSFWHHLEWMLARSSAGMLKDKPKQTFTSSSPLTMNLLLSQMVFPANRILHRHILRHLICQFKYQLSLLVKLHSEHISDGSLQFSFPLKLFLSIALKRIQATWIVHHFLHVTKYIQGFRVQIKSLLFGALFFLFLWITGKHADKMQSY